jgi:hypothetical protein
MGQHEGPVVLRPRILRLPIRHGNRQRAGDRTTEMGSLLVLEPPDERDDGPYTGRHRRRLSRLRGSRRPGHA